jgi:thiol-disulfide isomerase/thioredoxin
MKQWCMTFLVALAAASSSSAALAEQMRFGAGTLADIEQRYAGGRFVAVLWSLDCAPCRRELELLGRLRQSLPDLDVVLISTDGVEHESAVTDVLHEYRLGDAESWIFADPNVERLRYAVDPAWFGEMPRAYLYEGDSTRSGISGPLTEMRLVTWLRAL